MRKMKKHMDEYSQTLGKILEGKLAPYVWSNRELRQRFNSLFPQMLRLSAMQMAVLLRTQKIFKFFKRLGANSVEYMFLKIER